jgi:elongator complex protein 4
MSTDRWGGPGWLNKLSWLFDASVTIAGFSGEEKAKIFRLYTLAEFFHGQVDPALSLSFPSYHGSFHIHSLPAPHSLLPASDKTSTLRGISSVSSSSGGRENNIAFKCMRKRLVFETHHLDAEGGVGERRTGPGEGEKGASNWRGSAGLEVEIEGGGAMEAAAAAERIRTGSLTKRKQVRFRGGII